tara:strand:+ start:419 stop:802 length:384 start_codon:yes stop_codon:yes gene_type:complete
VEYKKKYKTMTTFKDRYTLKKRNEESMRILNKYPDRCPIIVERVATEKTLPQIDRNKYLVPNSITFGQFIFIVRKRIRMDANDSIFLFIGDDNLVPISKTIAEVYEEMKDKEDGFLYCKYASESTFG